MVNKMPSIKLAHTQIHYEVVNADHPNLETIVLLGGLSRDHTIWRKVVPLLGERYRIILPDNRDAGQSSSVEEEYSIADLAYDTAALIRVLGLERLHVIGHSMGGFLGMHLAASHPELVSTLTLCGTAEKQTEVSNDYLRGRLALIEQASPDEDSPANPADILAVMPKLYCQSSLDNEKFVQEIIQYESSNPYPQTASQFKRQAKACLTHSAEKLLVKINCPTMVIAGQFDLNYPPETMRKLAKLIDGSKFQIIKDAGHMVQLEQPSALVKTFEKMIHVK